MGDSVRIEKQALSNALGQWDGGASKLAADYKAKAQEALAAFNNAEWAGNDNAGNEFKKTVDVQQVTEALGPAKYGDNKTPLNGAAAADSLVNLSVNSRKAVNRSLDSDAMQADELKKAREKMA